MIPNDGRNFMGRIALFWSCQNHRAGQAHVIQNATKGVAAPDFKAYILFCLHVQHDQCSPLTKRVAPKNFMLIEFYLNYITYCYEPRPTITLNSGGHR